MLHRAWGGIFTFHVKIVSVIIIFEVRKSEVCEESTFLSSRSRITSKLVNGIETYRYVGAIFKGQWLCLPACFLLLPSLLLLLYSGKKWDKRPLEDLPSELFGDKKNEPQSLLTLFLTMAGLKKYGAHDLVLSSMPFFTNTTAMFLRIVVFSNC